MDPHSSNPVPAPAPAPGVAPQKKLSTAALLGFIFSLVGVCLFPFALVGVILGIVGLVRVRGNSALGGQGLAIAAICIAPVTLFTTGILAAIAIPNFIKFQSRSKQSECRASLRALYTAQRAFYAEKERYAVSLAELGHSPDRGNRYAYFVATDGEVEERTAPGLGATPRGTGVGVDVARYGPETAVARDQLPGAFAGGASLGVTGTCPDCQFTAACAGQIDGDATLDVWSVSSAERRGPEGTIDAGTPYNDVNDVVN